ATLKLAGLHLSMMQYGESDSVCFLERAIIDSQAQALADYLNTSIAESSKIVSEELRGWYFFYANLAGIQNTINNQLHGLSKGRFCAGWIRHFQVLTQIGKGFYEIKQNCMLSGKALKEDLEQYKDSYTCELFPKTETSRLYHPLYQTMNERMLLNVDRTAIENAWRFSISKDSSITSNLFYAKKELMD
ncbi:MAG: hypothetical protein PUP46_10790, partial [Endozoicomonas sp. (ex Botrylloides leachii)]|nr:hypothetical protein [Endozoicomonas sp. (ex Botrylloides leachii)]